jgi:DNA-binding NtrC family response regulator/tetratricopeptide (TPR) repeat protein
MDADRGTSGQNLPPRSPATGPSDPALTEPAGFAKALALGDMHVVADDLQSALESYEHALSILADHPMWRRERAEARLRIAECHRKRGEYQEALTVLSRTRQGIDPKIDWDLEAKIVGRTGMVQQSLGDYLIAETNCKKAFEALRKSNDNEEIGLLELTLGNIVYRLGQIDRARDWYQSALFTFRRIDHQEGIARSLNNLGILLKSGPRWREAIDYLERALAVSEEAGNAPRIAAHCMNLGVLLTKSCEWTRALQVLSRALLTFRDIDNAVNVANTHIALGNLRLRLGQMKRAASHYQEALNLARRHGYRREEVLTLEFQGVLALIEGRSSEARNIFAEALQKAKAFAPEGDLVCEIKRRLAEEAIGRGDHVAATRFATESAWIASRIKNHCELGASLRVLGEAAWESGRPEAGLRYLENSSKWLRETPDLYEDTQTRIRFASLLVAEGNGNRWGSSSSARQALEVLEPVWERITGLDLTGLLADFVEVHARALVASGDLEGGLRTLDRGLSLADEQGLNDARPRLTSLRAELAENQAERILATSEEFQILQEFTPLDASVVSGSGSLQRLLDQMRSRLMVDRVLLAVGPTFDRLRVEGSIGLERPVAMLRTLAPVLESFEAGRTVWLTGNSASDPRLDNGSGRRQQEGPLAALRLRPGEDLWGVLAAERKSRGEMFGARDLRLLSLFGSLLSVAVEARHLAISQASESTAASKPDAFSDFLTVDTATRQNLALLHRVADSDATVLLRGETGTGKGLLAQCIHKAGRRRERKFIQVNCAALPEQLLESELFGHLQGSFTGAIRDKKGLIEEAEGGTLFLDEVDRSHRNVQAKLLQVLDRREFRPVGGLRAKTADVRIICATNTDLAAAIRDGTFLEDLYYRLNDFQVTLPSLRDRREDIPVLVRHFLSRFTKEVDRRPAGITREVLRRLMDHEWRGNVRELEKCVRRLIVLCEDGEWIGVDLLPPELQGETLVKAGPTTLKDAVHHLEADMIRRTLEAAGGNKSETSRRLRISYPSLLEKIRRYHLEDYATRKKPNSPS